VIDIDDDQLYEQLARAGYNENAATVMQIAEKRFSRRAGKGAE